MKIGFITNKEKDLGLAYTKEITDYAKALGCTVAMYQPEAKEIEDICILTKEQMYKEVSFVVVLGGDGTILRVSGDASKYDMPILGINTGTLGYLADVEKSLGKSALQKVINNNYTIEERMMLEAYTQGSDKKNIALNEVSVSNSGFSKMITFSLKINDDLINTYRADGIIVSTPTGSTAYNLSAGGPILKPDNELIAITTICAHNLFSRPFVVSGEDVVSIIIESDQSHINYSLDGKTGIPAKKGDIITIKRSELTTKIIKTTGMGFYDILRRKMMGS